MCELAKADSLIVKLKSDDRPQKSIMAAMPQVEIFLPLDGIIDLEEQVSRLQGEMDKAKGGLKKYESKLANKSFADHAPAEVVADVQEKAQDLRDKIESIQQSLNNFKA